MHVKYFNHLCGVKEIHLVRLAKTLILSKNLFTVPKTETMETRYPTVLKTVLILLSSLFVFSAQSAKAQLVFKDPTIEIGNDGALNTVYRFSNVTANVDALVKIDSIVNGAKLIEIDQTGFGFDNALQPKIQSGGNGTSYVVFSVKFVASNTTNPVTLSSITPTNLDLDGNNNLKEFCEFNLQGGTATFMSNNPEISVTANNGKFLAQNVAGNEYAGIDTTASAVMFYVKRSNVSQFSFRLGAIVTENSIAARQYSVYMKEFKIENPFTLPLTLLNFGAVVKNEKVQLNWSTTNHKDFSHFILQKSNNGRDFKDVMTMMTDATDFSTVHQYAYKDDVSNANATVIYYRLQMVDANTKFEYSPIRMVRLNAVTAVQIQAFPNPVTSELRVTIPISWQEKNVTYEIYNSNGSLLSRVQKNNAVQIQQLNVSSLGSGNYIIRVTNGQEISTTKFIKH